MDEELEQQTGTMGSCVEILDNREEGGHPVICHMVSVVGNQANSLHLVSWPFHSSDEVTATINNLGSPVPEATFYKEPFALLDDNHGNNIAFKWYQPKAANIYSGVRRFAVGDRV